MKIRVVFWACVCVLAAVLASCSKKDKNAIESTELVVDHALKPAQETIPEPDRFVSAIVLSPSTKLYLQGRDDNMHSIFSLKNNDIIEILLANNSDEPETTIKDETYLHAVYDSLDFWIPQNDIASTARAQGCRTRHSRPDAGHTLRISGRAISATDNRQPTTDNQKSLTLRTRDIRNFDRSRLSATDNRRPTTDNRKLRGTNET